MPHDQTRNQSIEIQKIETALRHPEYSESISDWVKWRLCYNGGEEFKDQYLFKYSKREEDDDFASRKLLTYVPGHARAVINIIRNAIAAKLPEVKREGNDTYLDMMLTNVDLHQSSMNSFVALEIVPLLLVQGKNYVVIDAPLARPGATLAEDSSRPFLFTIGAEDVLSWNRDDNTGDLTAILMRLHQEQVDKTTGLITSIGECFRFMQWIPEGKTARVIQPDGSMMEQGGPGVFVRTCNKSGEDMEPPRMLRISKIPVVEFRLVDSIMGEIADHQIALLNLTSTDMDQLWRGNFPLYTQQRTAGQRTIQPRGQKAKGTTGNPDRNDSKDNEKRQRQGVAKGVIYEDERPGWIAPGVDNLRVSMEKQQLIAQEIRVLVDLALTNISVKAMEQSGKSKLADRVGQEAGLIHIGNVLETGEKDIAISIHEFLGDTTTTSTVIYPATYSIKTQEERLAEAEELKKSRNSTRSPLYQKEIDKRIAEVILKPLVTAETLTTIQAEIDDQPWFDDDTDRARIIQGDNLQGLIDTKDASALRGYPEGSAEKATAERVARAAAITAASMIERIPPVGSGDE